VSLLEDDTIRALFDEEADDLLAQLDEGLPMLQQDGVAAILARAAHTLKGSAGVVGLAEVHGVAAALEAAFERVDEAGTPPGDDVVATIAAAVTDLRGLVDGTVDDPALVTADTRSALALLADGAASSAPSAAAEPDGGELAARVEHLTALVEALAATQLRVGAMVAASAGIDPADVREFATLRAALGATSAPAAGDGDSGEVLVVDDSPTMRAAHARMLRAGGFAVRTAPNGREALALLADAEPDLVVTDLEMPVMNGLRLIEAIRARSGAPATPILVVSSNGDDDVRRRCLALGAQGYVEKKDVDETRLVFEADRLVRR
jgi:two-component system chemotaxis response regulator CheY